MATKHGHKPKYAAPSPTYTSWVEMRRRCLNPGHKRYADYGGRGITICARWSEFANFLEDMGARPEGLSLDRINNAGNYEPGNCRWANTKTQRRNSRNIKLTEADVHAIQAAGGSMSNVKLGRRFGVSDVMIANILKGKMWRP